MNFVETNTHRYRHKCTLHGSSMMEQSTAKSCVLDFFESNDSHTLYERREEKFAENEMNKALRMHNTPIITVAGELNLKYPGHEDQVSGRAAKRAGSTRERQQDLCNKFLCDGNIMSMQACAFEFVTYNARHFLMGVLYPV